MDPCVFNRVVYTDLGLCSVIRIIDRAILRMGEFKKKLNYQKYTRQINLLFMQIKYAIYFKPFIP